MTSFRIEPFDLKKHYAIIAKWWFDRYRQALDLGLIPRTGFIAISKDKPIAAAWLLLTNSQMAVLSYIVSNPKAGLKEISVAVSALIQTAEEMAKASGNTFLLSVSTSTGLSKRLKKRFNFSPWRMHELVFKKI
jgi:hypothetical protein